MKVRTQHNRFARRIAVTSAALLGTALTPLPAAAQDSTWTGPGTDYVEGANWLGGIPTNRATFTNTGPTTVVIPFDASINEILFTADASNYELTNSANFTVNGAGITNQSSQFSQFINQGTLTFNNNALVDGGTAGFQLTSGSPVSGTNVALIFNNNSGIGATVDLTSTAGSASGAGMAAIGGAAAVTFNDTSHADGADLRFFAGTGSGLGGVGVAGAGVGGGSTTTFEDGSHADNASIGNVAGGGVAIAGGDAMSSATGVGGSALVIFNGTSHADGAALNNFGGTATAIGGGNGAPAVAVSGVALLAFNDDSHADNAEFVNTTNVAVAIGGPGNPGTPGGDSGNGGTATAVGSATQISFDNNSHADNSTFTNTNSGVTVLGGQGGNGDTGAGGLGGGATGVSGSGQILFNDNSHANNSTFSNTSFAVVGVGGGGGTGGTTGAGGAGGSAVAVSSGTLLVFANATGTTGATITNNAGAAVAVGGSGGAGGNGAAGGAGGDVVANGGSASILFSGTASAGTGTTIDNRGGDGVAAGGSGGAGGTAAGGNGGLGGSGDAQGGDAIVTFQDNASAGNAVITNMAGTGTITGGNGGNGNVGNGGAGGSATAQGGDAIIRFNDNATAGSATLINISAAPLTSNGGTAGTNGVGGGSGGAAAGGAVSSGGTRIEFNDNSTGGSASITNNGGLALFNDNSVFGTAAGALIVNNTFGGAAFTGNSSLGIGTIQNNSGGSATFNDTATAGSGTINNGAGGFVSFFGGSTAGSAAINNAAGGTVQFVDNSLAGTSVISNSGSLIFIGASDAVAARVVNSGTGAVIIGVNAFRLGSLSGGGTVNNAGNTIQVGYLNLTDTFSGVISGAGGLVKRGTGTLILTGQNTYTGLTTIQSGTLQVDGRINSTTTAVVAGATLSGIGSLSGVVSNAGIISPGNAANPLGTLTVDFGVTFVAGSVLAPTVTAAGQSSLLQAGSLFLAGSVRPTAAPGGLFLMQSDYRIAVGTTGRFGTFGGVDESLLPGFIDASLFYTSTEVFLRLRRNATTFAQTANLTPNQSAVSTSLDAAVAANNPLVFTTYLPTYNALLGLSAANLPGALNVLSGDALTAVPVAAQEHGNRFAHRLDAYTWSNSSNVWGLIAYGDQEADSDGNGPGFDSSGLEFQMGFNTSLGANTRLGLSVGYNDADVDISDRLATADVETWSLGAQLRHDFGPVYVAGQLTYSWHSIGSSRALFLGGTAGADYDATTLTAAGEIGWVIQSGKLAIEPHLSLRHASTEQDGYSETGPVGVLDVAAADYETTRFGFGVRLANRDPASPVRFYALARYEHETGDSRSVLDNTLPGLPTFTVFGTRLGDDIFTGEVGAEFRISNGLSLFAAGGGHTRSNETSLNANAGLRIAF